MSPILAFWMLIVLSNSQCYGKQAFCNNENRLFARACEEYDAKNPTVVVKDSTGRVGNHMWSYTVLMAIRLMFGHAVYVPRRSYNILSPFFDQLTIFPAEDHLCDFDHFYKTFWDNVYNMKVQRIHAEIEKRAGSRMDLKRDPKNGKLVVTREMYQDPDLKLDNIVHMDHINELDGDYVMANEKSSFPWELYTGSIQALGNSSFKSGRSLIYYSSPSDLDYINDYPDLVRELDKSFVFKPKFRKMAEKTIDRILAQSSRKKKKKNLLVGIHSRRTDHLSYDAVRGNAELKPSYYLEAMGMFRTKYGKKYNLLFLFVSDDIAWGKSKLAHRNSHMDLYFVSANHLPTEESVGHDLAVMSMCNHTITSHGTFSYWSGFLAGGAVVTPNHFPQLRKKGVDMKLYSQDPLDFPLPRIHNSYT